MASLASVLLLLLPAVAAFEEMKETTDGAEARGDVLLGEIGREESAGAEGRTVGKEGLRARPQRCTRA